MATKKRSWLLWLAAVFVLIVAAVIAVPFVVPMAKFVPQIEQLASKALGQPVKVSSLRLQMVPTPRVVIAGLDIGAHHEITAGKVSVVPVVGTLLSGPRQIGLVRAEDLTVRESAIKMLDTLPKGGGGSVPILVRRVELRNVAFEHHALKLPHFDATIDLDSALKPKTVRLSTRDGALVATATPSVAGSVGFEVKAKNWKLPFAQAPLVFEQLDLQGIYAGNQVEVPTLKGRIYGGTLKGRVHADWERLWRVKGKAKLAGVELEPLERVLRKPVKLTGKLTTEARYSAVAKTPERLADALVLDAPFSVAGGVYHGIDLSRLSERPLGKLAPGGETKFEELRGKLALRGRHTRLSELCVRSPLLSAAGHVEIAPDQKLSGKLDVSLRKTGGVIGVPVALSGTTQDPSVSLTKGAAIGAVIGTVLLPVIGTQLGMSAGSSIEGKASCK